MNIYKKNLELLSKNHVYLTASINEPAGMHHIEGALSGLPIIYRNSGAIPEYCSDFGVSFHDLEVVNSIDNTKITNRIFELINRTNQLNYTKIRLDSNVDVKKMINDKDYIVYIVKGKDKYAYYDIIGTVIFKKSQHYEMQSDTLLRINFFLLNTMTS